MDPHFSLKEEEMMGTTEDDMMGFMDLLAGYTESPTEPAPSSGSGSGGDVYVPPGSGSRSGPGSTDAAPAPGSAEARLAASEAVNRRMRSSGDPLFAKSWADEDEDEGEIDLLPGMMQEPPKEDFSKFRVQKPQPPVKTKAGSERRSRFFPRPGDVPESESWWDGDENHFPSQSKPAPRSQPARAPAPARAPKQDRTATRRTVRRAVPVFEPAKKKPDAPAPAAAPPAAAVEPKPTPETLPKSIADKLSSAAGGGLDPDWGSLDSGDDGASAFQSPFEFGELDTPSATAAESQPSTTAPPPAAAAEPTPAPAPAPAPAAASATETEGEVAATPEVARKKVQIRFTKRQRVSLVDQQHDPDNPLYSAVGSFEELQMNPLILKAIHAQGFSKPSKIQGLTLPLILRSPAMNLIAQAQSGTGKTLCFAVAAIHSVDPRIKAPQVICICPTLELASQNYRRIVLTGEYFPAITMLDCTRGQKLTAPTKCQILVGTTGTLVGWIKRRLIGLDKVKLLILDEADEILEQPTNSMKNQTMIIKNALPRRRRILLFSATFQSDGGEGQFESEDDRRRGARLRTFASSFVPTPRKVILVPKEKLAIETMKHYWLATATFDEKAAVIEDIYCELTVGQTIIFLNRKNDANALHARLVKKGHAVSRLHGGLETRERKSALVAFEENKTKVLIATNVLARGVDVPTVTHVINFDLPQKYVDRKPTGEPDYATYLHRVGRTARFGAYGCAISLVDRRTAPWVKKIAMHFRMTIKKVDLDKVDELEY